MSSHHLLRFSGMALLIGSVAYILFDVLTIALSSPGSDAPPPYAAIIGLIGLVILIMGMPGILVPQVTKVGTLGLIGWIVFFCSALLGLGLLVNATVFLPLDAQPAPNGPPPAPVFALIITVVATQFIGGVLLGIATIRARIFPSWIGWLLIASSLISAASFPLEGMASTLVTTGSDLLLMAALGWIGYQLAKASSSSRVAATI
jgi:hypothetical protein